MDLVWFNLAAAFARPEILAARKIEKSIRMTSENRKFLKHETYWWREIFIKKTFFAVITMLSLTFGLAFCTVNIYAAPDGWVQDRDGYWYFYRDGEMLKKTWEKINGRWYRFNFGGVMETGFRYQLDGTYYMDSTGAMVSSRWIHLDDKWFYFDADGKMHTGWLTYNGKRYFLRPDTGVMAASTIISYLIPYEVNDYVGNRYTIDASGVLIGIGLGQNGKYMEMYPANIVDPENFPDSI